MRNKPPQILIVVAHPDDVILGFGGTLLHLVNVGASIAHLSLTKGERIPGLKENARVQELYRAYEEHVIPRIRKDSQFKLIFSDLQDGAIPATGSPVQDLEAQLLEEWGSLEFDLAFLHWREDFHVDHVNAARIGYRLARNVRSLLYFQSWSSHNFQSPLCVNVTKYWKDRMEMLDYLCEHHQRQAKARIEARAKYHGDIIRIKSDPIGEKYAEAFDSDRIDLITIAEIFHIESKADSY